MVPSSTGRRSASKARFKAKNTQRKNSNFNKIKEAFKKKKNLTCSQIITLLSKQRNFVGCFASDRIQNLSFQNFPSYLLVNVQPHSMIGSHWLCLGVFQQKIEIFDPLGFDFLKWDLVPCQLLDFIHSQSEFRKIEKIRQIQPTTSKLCTFYCLLYILLRDKFSLRKIASFFSDRLSSNDSRLGYILKKYFISDGKRHANKPN